MNSTKVISARIPLTEYTDLLSRAKEANMILADYLIFVLFSEKNVVMKADRSVAKMEKEVSGHKSELAELRQELSKTKDKLAAQQLEFSKIQQKYATAIADHDDFVDDMLKFVKKLNADSLLTDYKPAIEFVEKHRWQKN